MFTIVIDVGKLHTVVWENLDQTGCMNHINSLVSKEGLTLSLFRAAVASCFASCEIDQENDYTHILADCFQQKNLYEHCLSKKMLAEEYHYVKDRTKEGLDSYGTRVAAMPPKIEMTYMIFIETFENIVSYVNELLVEYVPKGEKDWRWRCVEFDAVLDKHNRITALSLAIGVDIRHVVYNHLFSGQRYDSSLFEKLGYSKPDYGFRYDGRGRVVSASLQREDRDCDELD